MASSYLSCLRRAGDPNIGVCDVRLRRSKDQGLPHEQVGQTFMLRHCPALAAFYALRRSFGPLEAEGLPRKLLAVVLIAGALAAPAADGPRVVRVLDISPVWAGHPVGFDLLTSNGRQFVAFYDEQRRMTVAARELKSDRWHLVRLPSEIGWDSHNYITMAADDDGYVHLSGNMHVSPLVYFRTAKPWDIDSFEAIHKMTGSEETRCTYPRFFRGPRNELIFTYRDGKSGNGNQIFNVYDHRSRTWRRLLDKPLLDGQGRMNAYIHGPIAGPDGFFHLVWVWRDTPDCSTNHDLSYARSRDLVHWETSAGKPLAVPIRVETGEIVDPVPVKGGLLNGAAKIAWDSKGRPVITYHKFDARGRNQAYAARLEGGAWKIYQISNWDYRWEFQGGGSLPVVEIQLGTLRRGRAGELLLEYRHIKYGSGVWRLDERTFKQIATLPVERAWPAQLERPESSFPGIQVHLVPYRGQGDMTYLLRWETLGANRDRPREGPLPSPSMLRLYELAR